MNEIYYKKINLQLLEKHYDELLSLKNYNSSLHFKSDYIDIFNRNKLNELYEYLPTKKAILYGAFKDDNVKGFIWAYPRIFFDENRLFINTIVVSKDFQKMGIGKKLFELIYNEALTNNVDAIDLTVKSDNYGALGFYDSLGFQSERIQLRLGIKHD